jgi:hypothetical protein
MLLGNFRNLASILRINCTAEFDRTLFERFGSFIGDPGHSLRKKLTIISMYSESPIFRNETSFDYEVRELYRFDMIFPVNQEDKRKFHASRNSHAFVEMRTSLVIKFFGIIFAGAVKEKDFFISQNEMQVYIRVYNENNQILLEEGQVTRGKFSFLSFSKQLNGKNFRIFVSFYKDGYFYCGKALCQGDNKVVKDQVTFEFLDRTGNHCDLKGPILGILYSLAL